MVALPDMYAKLKLSLDDWKSGLAVGQRDAMTFKAGAERTLGAMKVGIDTAAAMSQLERVRHRAEDVKASMERNLAQLSAGGVATRAPEAIPLKPQDVSIDVAAIRRQTGEIARPAEVKPIEVAPLRPKLEFEEAQVRKGVADAVRVARSQLAEKSRAIDFGGFDAVAEARQRFLGTAAAAKEVAAQTTTWGERKRSVLDTAIRVGAAVQGARAAVKLVTAGVELWSARQADVNGNFKKAAEGYLGFANTVKSAPIVGGIAYDLANFFSGGKAEKAKAALEDAAAQNAHTAMMKKRRDDANAAAEANIRRNRAESGPPEERELSLAAITRDEAVKGIREQMAAKQLSAEVGKRAIESEFQKYNAVWDAWMRKRHDDTAREAAERDRKAAEQAKKISEPLDAMRQKVAGFGMTDDQKALADFKAIPGVKPQDVEQYESVARQLADMKKKHDMSEEAKKWKEGLKGPAEAYDEIIAKLKAWKAAKQITPEEFEKGVADAKGDLAKHKPRSERQETRVADLIKAGGADAIRFQFKAEGNALKERLSEAELREAQRQTRVLESIDRRLDLDVK